MEREPGLLVTNTKAENKNKKIPIQICNHTNRTFKLRKGKVVGKAERVNVSCIQSVNYPRPKTGGGEYQSETARRNHEELSFWSLRTQSLQWRGEVMRQY